jgi:hypothetical protein
LQRELGFRTVLRSETERIVDKTDTIIRVENVLVPLRDTFSSFEFHHWQDAEGNLKFMRSDLVRALTGELINHEVSVIRHSGHEIMLRCDFEHRTVVPLKLTLEIRAPNYFPNLFTIGTGYTEYDIVYPVDHFLYRLVVPNKKGFRNFEVFANGQLIKIREESAELIWLARFGYLQPRAPVKITINNRDID